MEKQSNDFKHMKQFFTFASLLKKSADIFILRVDPDILFGLLYLLIALDTQGVHFQQTLEVKGL